MNLIIAVNMPLIFISIVSSVCAMEDIATLSNIGVKILKRFFITMTGIILTTTCISAVIFPVVSWQNNSEMKRVIGDGKVLMFKIMEVVLKLLARLALKYKISVKDFLRKISPVLVIAFVTMSSSASMAKNFEVCKHSLKLN